MNREDTILIKIGHSYKEGMSEEELYHATSVSWKISEYKLQSGALKYYCAVYDNVIKEVYDLIGFKKDMHPENIGRFILEGKIADELIRSKLLGLDVKEVHKGAGNPIKYECMDKLLKLVGQEVEIEDDFEDNSDVDENKINKDLLKILFTRLASKHHEINTLVTNKTNWISKVDDKGIYVETITSREKYNHGEKNHPYVLISFDFIFEAWKEFIDKRSVTADDFTKTRGRTTFLMAFFSLLPFVDNERGSDKSTIFLKEFTTDQLPEANLNQTINLLEDILNNNLDPKKISRIYHDDDAVKRLKLRARQGLKLLGFLTENYEVIDQTFSDYQNATNKNDFLAKRMIQNEYLSLIFDLLKLLESLDPREKVIILVEIGMLIVRNSMGQNLMKKSVADYRTWNILTWFKDTDMVDEQWNIKFDPSKAYLPGQNVNKVIENGLKTLSIREVISHIDQYIKSKGFYYEEEEIENLYISLRTKPFVILSGISGTGKTMIIRWLAESIGATNENGQFTLIPVRPDWNDGSDLLGYTDIKGAFIVGPLVQSLVKALKNPEKPYFIVLDEMNLARVEYYFSDILSVMETREFLDEKIKTKPLINEIIDGESIIIPENVYFIGTVNMDETTHPFSKKVLDRANTIEFNEINLENIKFLGDLPAVDPIKIHNDSFVSKYVHLKDVYLIYSDIVENASKELVKINNILKPIGAQIGYRVRDEICFYLAYNHLGKVMTFEKAFDRCILQKILPRISGSEVRIERTLIGLLEYYTNKKYGQDYELFEDEKELAIYPKSANKTFEMLRRLREDGFTSFWVS